MSEKIGVSWVALFCLYENRPITGQTQIIGGNAYQTLRIPVVRTAAASKFLSPSFLVLKFSFRYSIGKRWPKATGPLQELEVRGRPGTERPLTSSVSILWEQPPGWEGHSEYLGHTTRKFIQCDSLQL